MKGTSSTSIAAKILMATGLFFAIPAPSAIAQVDEDDAIAGRANYPTPVINLKTGLCLTATGGELSLVIQERCTGASERLWRTELASQAADGYFYFRLRNAQTGLCADLQTYSDANGAIALRQCNGELSQQWYGVPTGNQFQYARVMNRVTKKCLDAQVNGPNVQQWSCGSRDNQRWLVNF